MYNKNKVLSQTFGAIVFSSALDEVKFDSDEVKVPNYFRKDFFIQTQGNLKVDFLGIPITF